MLDRSITALYCIHRCYTAVSPPLNTEPSKVRMGKKKSKQRPEHALDETLGVRLSEIQRGRLREACRIVAARKGEPVDESVLARDFIMRGVDETMGAAAITPEDRRSGTERRTPAPV